MSPTNSYPARFLRAALRRLRREIGTDPAVPTLLILCDCPYHPCHHNPRRPA